MRIGIMSAADLALAEKVESWIARNVDCILGRREFSTGRYCVAVIGGLDEFGWANQSFLHALKCGTVSSCYYALRCVPTCPLQPGSASPIELLRSMLPPTFACNGESVSQSIVLKCPVTRVPVLFDDFDFVGFYPEAKDPDHLFYDPSNASPYIGVNQASDLYGFACFVADLAGATLEMGIASLVEPKLRGQLFCRAKRMWNDMAGRTLHRIGSKTDAGRLCPAQVTADGHHYLTAHNEAAFVESEKIIHQSEMPCIYLDRLISAWEGWFQFGMIPDLSGVVRPATVVPGCPAHPAKQSPWHPGPTWSPYQASQTQPGAEFRLDRDA